MDTLIGFIGCKSLAQRLDLHPSTLRRLEERGELVPAGRVGGKRIYAESAVAKYENFRKAKQTFKGGI